MARKKYPLLREPYESELTYFKKNPHVAGMATEDDRVIFNPYSSVIPHQSDAIYKNESSRTFMKKFNRQPKYELTDDQKSRFKDYGSDSEIKSTIAARGLSGDESSGEMTSEQKHFIKRLASQMRRSGY